MISQANETVQKSMKIKMPFYIEGKLHSQGKEYLYDRERKDD